MFQAETDAANLIVQCKLRANPENAVGVLTMAELVLYLLNTIYFLYIEVKFPKLFIQGSSRTLDDDSREQQTLHEAP